MIPALFDINADGQDHGYQATNGEVLTLTLRDPSAASTVLFQVDDPAGANEALGVAANPPRASKGAPTLTLEGATSGFAVSPPTVDGAVTVTIPASGAHSWIVRCVVDGGRRTLPSGTTVVDPSLIFERGIFIPLGATRKVVITESTQFELDGWAGALADMADAVAAGGGGGGLAPGSYVGQPAIWDGSAWVPLAPGDALVVDRIQAATTGLFIAPTVDLRMDAPSIVLDTSSYTDPCSIAMVGAGIALTASEHGFFGATPVERPSITEGDVAPSERLATQVDSLVAALVALGLVSDDRYT